jgi:hypothetical protein
VFVLAYRTNKKQPKASVISKKKIDDFPSGGIFIVFIARTLAVMSLPMGSKRLGRPTGHRVRVSLAQFVFRRY